MGAGVTIVSGLALGIDAAAHKAALDKNGRTIAVLGSGVDVIYPAEHRHLAAEIANNGALVSEFAPGTQPDRSNFPVRNRTISGLSLGVVVVEAPERSGALLTADAAAEQGREVFALPGNVVSQTSLGTNRLIQNGAKLVMDVNDILDELNLTRVDIETSNHMREVIPDNEQEAALLALLGDEPQHIDELCRLSAYSITEVSSTLALMELKGMARRHEGMLYTRARGGSGYRLD